MFGGAGSSGSGSSSVVGGSGENQVQGGSSYTKQQHHTMNMNIDLSVLLPPRPFQQQLLSPTASVGVGSSRGGGGGGGGGGVGGCDDDEFPRRDERMVLWGNQETRDFVAIRAGLEGEFTGAKRNKALWEIVAAKMKDLGYHRTPDQCKCKWKNLVNRYKVQETSDADNDHQFPFFDELHAVFSTRSSQMQRSPHESEAGSMQSRKRIREVRVAESSEEPSEDDEGDDESDENRALKDDFDQNRKVEKVKRPRMAASAKAPRPPSTTDVSNNGSVLATIQEMLQNFFQQQLRIEMEWKKSMEKHAKERELFEQEWRHTMEKFERERIMLEQSWREREEQRRAREESRAERREVLLTTLLKKLIQEKDI